MNSATKSRVYIVGLKAFISGVGFGVRFPLPDTLASAILIPGKKPYTLPMGSYPTPFLKYLLFYMGDPNHKTR